MLNSIKDVKEYDNLEKCVIFEEITTYKLTL